MGYTVIGGVWEPNEQNRGVSQGSDSEGASDAKENSHTDILEILNAVHERDKMAQDDAAREFLNH